jgi:D-xylose transport system ATP-binding protein
VQPVVPTLELRGVVKRYGQVAALTDVDFTAAAGEVVALVGDNGAGKSTLIKAIAGTHRIDGGQILIDGAPVTIGSPTEASALGIETVYQDLALCDNLSVVQNLFLGRERRTPDLPFINRFLDNRRMRQEAETVVAQLGTRLPSLSTQIGAMSGGQRQAVAVARAVIWGSRLVLLDEPTAALGVQQTANVHNLIKRLRDKGVAIVLITHNLVDAFALADSMVVLRLGRRIAIMDAKRNTPDEVVGAITGSTLAMRSTA